MTSQLAVAIKSCKTPIPADLKDVPHQLQLQADVLSQNVQVRAALAEHVKLKHDANASSDAGGNRGPCNAEPGKRPKAPDQAGIEEQIDAVRQPENTHGNGCISGAAKDRIDEKKQQDDAGTAQHDSRVKRADAQNPRTGSHPAKQFRRKWKRNGKNQNREPETDQDRLDSGFGSAILVMFAHAPRHHGGGPHAEPESHRHDEHQHAFGDANGSS